MTADPTLELPFDAYQRYRLVADLVERYPTYEGARCVLDVGGRTGLMRAFLPEARVEIVDVEPSGESGMVIGSGGALPFRDGAFDVVTACDTLEHVPAEHRAAFVAECARVSRGWVILAGPYDGPEVREAEASLRVFLREKAGMEHRYLNEHAEYGLPSRAETEDAFRAAGCEVASVGHAGLARWLPLMCLEMYCEADRNLREVAKRYFKLYNASLYATDHAGPVYRHAVIAAKAGVALPSTEGLFERPVAPAAAYGVFHECLSELVAFDRERDAYDAERERMRVVNEGLHADLLGHAETLSTLRKDLAEHEDCLRSVREDLDAHRATLAERTREYEAEHEARERYEREWNAALERIEELRHAADAARDVKADLEADLAGHRDTVAALRAEAARERDEHEQVTAALTSDLEQHRRVVEELRAEARRKDEAMATLQAELASRHAEVARIEAERDEARRDLAELRETTSARIEALEHELTAEHQRVEHLTHDLEDRWKNFRRAFELRRRAE